MKQTGILTAEALVKWKKDQGLLSVPVVPNHVIVCPQHVALPTVKKLTTKKIKGLMGNHVCVSVDRGVYLSTGWGIGGSSLVAVCEELRALGATRFTLIGLAGRLSEDIKEGEVRYASSAICEEGTSAHYLESDNKQIVSIRDQELALLGIEGDVFVSTDAPFRETEEKCLSWRASGASLVDMETASLYAFARYYDLEALSIGIGADALFGEKWSQPGDMNLLNGTLQQTVFEYIETLK